MWIQVQFVVSIPRCPPSSRTLLRIDRGCPFALMNNAWPHGRIAIAKIRVKDMTEQESLKATPTTSLSEERGASQSFDIKSKATSVIESVSFAPGTRWFYRDVEVELFSLPSLEHALLKKLSTNETIQVSR